MWISSRQGSNALTFQDHDRRKYVQGHYSSFFMRTLGLSEGTLNLEVLVKPFLPQLFISGFSDDSRTIVRKNTK